MDFEKLVKEFVERLQKSAGANLQSVILYGSTVSGGFHPEFSNVNLLCILRETSLTALQAVAPVATWWNSQKQPAPLIMTKDEIARSTDVFSIELLDMKQSYRVVFGEDVLKPIEVSLRYHRVQVEYELREKLILLRQSLLLAAADGPDLLRTLQRSAPSFATLFRHALIALGEPAVQSRREAVDKLAARIGFDASALNQLLDIREGKAKAKDANAKDLCNRYLASLEQVVAAVDTALDLPETKG